MKYRKSLGQYFLRDPKILKKIVDFAQIKKTDTVVEIGPGEGTLTALLLERAKQVIAVEKDKKLAEQLRKKITDSKLQIVEDDILNYNLKSIDYKLVGNIPYNITGKIFRKFLESDHKPKSITFVVQKEVADRIMARDGKESVLSISIKAFGDPEYGGTIKAGSFVPRPKVDSAIIAVRDIHKSNIDLGLVKKGFSHKRKFVIGNLGIDKEVFEKCGISHTARAEELRVEDWIRLAKNLL